MGILISSITAAKVQKNSERQQIFHFSLFTFTFFYYLCSVKLKEDEKQTILE